MRVLKGGVQAYFSAIRGNRRMASMASKFAVVKFDGTGNFGLWQTRVKDLLAQQGLSKTLSDQKPEKVDDDKWEEMTAQACATIRLCVSDQIMYHVMEETSPKKIWDKLEGKFMSKTLTNKLFLKQKLFGLKIQEGSDLATHINVFNQLVADLLKVEVKVDDGDGAIILLCSLPSSYEHLVTTLTVGKTEISLAEVVAVLLSHDQMKKHNAAGDSTGECLHVKDDQVVGDKKSRSKKKKGPRCYECGDWRHMRRNCTVLKKDSGSVSVASASRRSDSDSDGDLLTISSDESCEAWSLDSGSSFHAMPKREFFILYRGEQWWFSTLG